jgi:short-subunit dehydrogenase
MHSIPGPPYCSAEHEMSLEGERTLGVVVVLAGAGPATASAVTPAVAAIRTAAVRRTARAYALRRRRCGRALRGIAGQGALRRLGTMRTFLITGASSGIGSVTARRLAREPDVRLVLVARRAERLEALAAELAVPVSICAVDLTDEDAPARVRAHVEATGDGTLDVLVNNAGAGFRARFGEEDGGHANVRRTFAVNFDAVVRLTEALLPLLRAKAAAGGSPALVNVSSTSGRIARGGTSAYSASKFALNGWTDAVWAEERVHGVHVGLVLPGFIATEGFPQTELVSRRLTRWMVSDPSVVAEAIVDCALKGKVERYAPRPYVLAAAVRILLPGLTRRVLGGGGGTTLTTSTNH